jgi:hypothetical protein
LLVDASSVRAALFSRVLSHLSKIRLLDCLSPLFILLQSHFRFQDGSIPVLPYTDNSAVLGTTYLERERNLVNGFLDIRGRVGNLQVVYGSRTLTESSLLDSLFIYDFTTKSGAGRMDEVRSAFTYTVRICSKTTGTNTKWAKVVHFGQFFPIL